jgi:hypothetical protein
MQRIRLACLLSGFLVCISKRVGWARELYCGDAAVVAIDAESTFSE